MSIWVIHSGTRGKICMFEDPSDIDASNRVDDDMSWCPTQIEWVGHSRPDHFTTQSVLSSRVPASSVAQCHRDSVDVTALYHADDSTAPVMAVSAAPAPVPSTSTTAAAVVAVPAAVAAVIRRRTLVRTLIRTLIRTWSAVVSTRLWSGSHALSLPILGRWRYRDIIWKRQNQM